MNDENEKFIKLAKLYLNKEFNFQQLKEEILNNSSIENNYYIENNNTNTNITIYYNRQNLFIINIEWDDNKKYNYNY